MRVFVPLGGFSNHDSDQGHIHEPDLPAPFADYLRSVLPADVAFETRACHFNDPEFADAIVAATRALVRESETGVSSDLPLSPGGRGRDRRDPRRQRL